MRKKLLMILSILAMLFAGIGFVGCDDNKGGDSLNTSNEFTASENQSQETTDKEENGDDDTETDGNKPESGDDTETDGNKPESGDDTETDGNKPESGDDTETDGNKPESGDDTETDGNKPEQGEDGDVQGNKPISQKEWDEIFEKTFALDHFYAYFSSQTQRRGDTVHLYSDFVVAEGRTKEFSELAFFPDLELESSMHSTMMRYTGEIDGDFYEWEAHNGETEWTKKESDKGIEYASGYGIFSAFVDLDVGEYSSWYALSAYNEETFVYNFPLEIDGQNGFVNICFD